MKYEHYVMCSTLNQMVNYLPYRMFFSQNECPQLHTISYSNEGQNQERRNGQKEWNDFLKDAINRDTGSKPNINDLAMEPNALLSLDSILKRLNDDNDLNEIKTDQPILWNITGGQRILALAIHEYVKLNKRENDEIIYLEGNTASIYSLRGKEDTPDKVFVDNLKIETAFNLMGFKVNRDEYTDYTMLLESKDQAYDQEYQEYQAYKQLLSKMYPCNRDDSAFRIAFLKKMVQLNKKNDPDTDKSIKNEVVRLCKNNNVEISEYKEFHQSNCPLGIMLEKMTLYTIIKALEKNMELKNIVSEVVLSSKINDTTVESNQIIDEFDVLLLTKSGQIVIFECKSGGMSGDNAKSHHYSTYAVSGVYGTPVLITPLTDTDIKKEIHEETGFEHIKSARNSAERAKLEQWSLDNIEKKLEERFRKHFLEGDNDDE